LVEDERLAEKREMAPQPCMDDGVRVTGAEVAGWWELSPL